MNTVLVVDDEPTVLTVLVAVLKAKGYRVIAARRGDEAIQLFGQPGPPVDLLLTDVVMPDMSGVEVADRLLETDPKLKVLFIAGMPDSPDIKHRVLDRGRAFLPKPFLPATLIEEVEAVLGRRAARAIV